MIDEIEIYTKSPLDYIGTTRPVLLVPSNDTHVEWMLPLAKKLNDSICMVLPDRKEGALEKLQKLGENPVFYREGCIRWLAPSVVVLANDWGPEEYQIVQEAKLLGIPSICIQEGSVFFPSHTVQVLKNADYAFVCGLRTPAYLKRSNIILTGSPKYDSLFSVSLPLKPVVIINCNFTYGIFEEIRMQWLGEAINACNQLGLEYFISQHPRDKATLPADWPVIRSSDIHYIEQLKRGSILISRFSTMIYEALMLGREVVYYDPHGENPDIYSEDIGIYRAHSQRELVEQLSTALATVGKQRVEIKKFLEDYCGPLDHQATDRCLKAIQEISHKNIYVQKKYIQCLRNAEQEFAEGEWEKAISAYSEALKFTPAEPKLRIARGNLHLLNKEIYRGFRDFYYASVLNPDYLPARIHLAYAYILLGELEKAREQVEFTSKNVAFTGYEEFELVKQLIDYPPPTKAWKITDIDIWELPSVKKALLERSSYADEIQFHWQELALLGIYGTDIVYRTIVECQHKIFPTNLLPYFEKIWQEQNRKPRVLDVGAGPLTQLVYGITHEIFDLIAVDPLADVYLDFHKILGYEIPYPLIKSNGEELASLFEENSFDLIWMNNAIDHSENPRKVMEQMTRVLRPCGYIFLSGYVREASYAITHGFAQGLHCYDIYITDENEVVYEHKPSQLKGDGTEKVVLTAGLPLELIDNSHPSQKIRDWMYAVWRKRSD
jgi:SAM-dependent methyltransferase